MARPSHALFGTWNNSKNSSSLANGTVTSIDCGGSEGKESSVEELHDCEKKPALVGLLSLQVTECVEIKSFFGEKYASFIDIAASRAWDLAAEHLFIHDQSSKS